MSRIKNYDAQMLAMEYQARSKAKGSFTPAYIKMPPELPHLISNLSLGAGKTLFQRYLSIQVLRLSLLGSELKPIDPYDDDAPSRMARRHERMMQNVNPDAVLSKESIVRAIVEIFHRRCTASV